MKKTHSTLASLALMTLVPHAALAGAGSSGGGSYLAGQFMIDAYRVVSRIAFVVGKDKTTIDPAVLQETLKTLEVKVVDTLIDPSTQKPVDDDSLEAFGSPGLIQLKKSAPWQKYILDRASDFLVAHEILRATGKYDDNGYRISIGTLQLNCGYARVLDLPKGLYTTNEQRCAARLDIDTGFNLQERLMVEWVDDPIHNIECLGKGKIWILTIGSSEAVLTGDQFVESWTDQNGERIEKYCFFQVSNGHSFIQQCEDHHFNKDNQWYMTGGSYPTVLFTLSPEK